MELIIRRVVFVVRGIFLVLICLSGDASVADEVAYQIRTVDADGAPVAGANVEWTLFEHRLRLEFPKPHERGRTNGVGEATILAVSDDDIPINSILLMAYKDGLVCYRRLQHGSNSPEIFELELLERVETSGVVRDDANNPLEGVVVGTQHFPYTVTDASGRYAFLGNGFGDALSFYKPGYEWKVTLAEWVKGDVVLRKAQELTFQAVDPEGKSLPNAAVNYTPTKPLMDNGQPLKAGYAFNSIDARADEAGFFTTLPFAGGAWIQLYGNATRSGSELRYPTQLVQIPQPPPEVIRLVFAPPPARTRRISGQVIMAETGEPVKAKVRVVNGRERVAYGPASTSLTDEDGRFTVEALRQQSYLVHAVPLDPYKYPIEEVYAANTREGDVDELVIEVGLGCMIEGRVVRGDGKPFGNSRVSLFQKDDNRFSIHRERTSKIAADGSFVLKNLAPDPNELTVRTRGAEAAVVLPAPGAALRGVDLYIPSDDEKAFLTGIVLNENGDLAPGIDVGFRLTTPDGSLHFVSGDTNDAGRFKIESEHFGTAVLDNVSRSFKREGGSSSRVAEIVSAPPPVEITPGKRIEGVKITIIEPERPE